MPHFVGDSVIRHCSLVLKYLVVMAISVDFGPKAYKFRLSENYCLVNIKIILYYESKINHFTWSHDLRLALGFYVKKNLILQHADKF